MQKHKYHCIERIVETAKLLGELADEVVFLGGSATGLLITDPAAPDIRPTIDIDVIFEVGTLTEYYLFQEKLKDKGFFEAIDEDVICRFKHGSLILDVMPTNPTILGFTNIWYQDAAKRSQRQSLEGIAIRIVTPAYFLATKIEAFHGRGQGDFMLSPDIEDIIAVIDGRPEIADDVAKADADVQAYLADQFNALLNNNDFLDALPGHLPGDTASQQRLPIIMARIEEIAGRQ